MWVKRQTLKNIVARYKHILTNSGHRGDVRDRPQASVCPRFSSFIIALNCHHNVYETVASSSGEGSRARADEARVRAVSTVSSFSFLSPYSLLTTYRCKSLHRSLPPAPPFKSAEQWLPCPPAIHLFASRLSLPHVPGRGFQLDLVRSQSRGTLETTRTCFSSPHLVHHLSTSDTCRCIILFRRI